MVPPAARTAPSSTRRTRPRSTRTSTRQLRLAGPGRGRSGTRSLGVVRFWVEQGVRIFRVDNPHTKPLDFWAWLIREVQDAPPGRRLPLRGLHAAQGDAGAAKVGFTQSYTYFTWRNFKEEMTEYLEELTRSEMAEYFRGNLFAEHPGHPPRGAPARRPAGLPACGSRSRPPSPRCRASTAASSCARADAAARQRGVPGLGEVPARGAGLERPGQHPRLHRPRSTAIRRENPRAPARRATCASTPPTTTHVLFYGKMHPGRRDKVSWSR